ncbi:MAG TPA: 30S ribosomal protein S1 [Silvibacterium sp.]|nr:30S ribosomal protein S1 [Silvibacterium sp.]
MTNESIPETAPSADGTPEPVTETTESFGALLSQFEQSHAHKAEDGTKQLEGTVVSISADSVFLDIGFKVEGVLSRGAFDNNADGIAPGDRFPVSVKGRNEEGYYELSRVKIARVTDWASLEEAFAQKSPITGRVTGVVKGGLSVDVGVRAFMPASRSGTRDAGELEKLVDQEITCRIIKLDVAEEDVVVDRRVIAEEQARSLEQSRFSELREGDIVSGQVRSLASYGAFVDLGAVDGLLHVSDISWSRVSQPEDVLSTGQQLQVKILKIDAESRRISLGLKQLQPEPWDSAAERYKVGQRITGAVTRLADFGAFVEVEPGIEGLIHVSEMSWVKKVRKPSDLLKQGDTVDAVVLSLNQGERRLSLGLKQALGDPWAEVPKRFPVGSAIEGPIVRMMKFGAFVQLTEGVEGLIHVSEISADKRINHPQDVFKAGQTVKAQVLGIDTEKRQIKLSIKQLIPTSMDEYLAEHAEGDLVSGRIVEQSGEQSSGLATVELGEGVRATCRVPISASAVKEEKIEAKPDLSSLTSMLQARWKGDAPRASHQSESLQAGQVRSFRIVKLDREAEKIEVELA